MDFLHVPVPATGSRMPQWLYPGVLGCPGSVLGQMVRLARLFRCSSQLPGTQHILFGVGKKAKEIGVR